jgi:CheY-like chemotaxis protein
MLRQRPRRPRRDAPAPAVRVLVVHDDPDGAELRRRLLVAEGYEVDVAPTAEEALRALDMVGDPEPGGRAGTAESEVGCVLLDLVRGGLSANVGLAGAIRARRAALGRPAPALLLVSDAAVSPLVAWRVGAEAILVRPYPARDMLQQVALARRDR